MTMLWINVLLAIPFIALWVGIPMWLVLKRPGHQADDRRGTRRPGAARGAPRRRRLPPRRLARRAGGPAGAGYQPRQQHIGSSAG
jgi:hypothetical protein